MAGRLTMRLSLRRAMVSRLMCERATRALVILLEQQGTDESDDGSLVGEEH
jgi:hypothetical protein